jgi:hypothetical protein
MLLLVLYGTVKRKSSEDKVAILHVYFAKKNVNATGNTINTGGEMAF